jgi:hypothetical protein
MTSVINWTGSKNCPLASTLSTKESYDNNLRKKIECKEAIHTNIRSTKKGWSHATPSENTNSDLDGKAISYYKYLCIMSVNKILEI